MVCASVWANADAARHGFRQWLSNHPRQWHKLTRYAAFDGHQYLVLADRKDFFGAHPGIQVLGADGARAQFPIRAFSYGNDLLPSTATRLGVGAGRFCGLSLRSFASTNNMQPPGIMVWGHATRPDFVLNIQRGTSNSLTLTQHLYTEYSTNMVDWVPGYSTYYQLMAITNHPRMFARFKDGTWTCLENLRAINWAKREWARDNGKLPYHVPVDSDLLSGRYLPAKPACPHNTFYSLGSVDTQATCTIHAENYP